jgi:hypothetical protein
VRNSIAVGHRQYIFHAGQRGGALEGFCNRLWPSRMRMKGLGIFCRDTGHSRVPDPPEMMQGLIR